MRVGSPTAFVVVLALGCSRFETVEDGQVSPQVAIVAHRGASWDAPENTLASVRLGWKQGADAVEVDVRLTRDGSIVVIHDETTKRTTGVDWLVRERTFAELRTLDAGSWKGPDWKGERIPSLAEILEVAPPGGRLLVEIKCGREILPELSRVLAASRRDDLDVTIIGFDLETVVALKAGLGLEAGWLSGWKKDERTGAVSPTVEDLVRRAVEAGVDALGVARDGPLDADAVRTIHEAGLSLNVWTVDDLAVARRLIDVGVDPITTNRPGWLRGELLAARGEGRDAGGSP